MTDLAAKTIDTLVSLISKNDRLNRLKLTVTEDPQVNDIRGWLLQFNHIVLPTPILVHFELDARSSSIFLSFQQLELRHYPINFLPEQSSPLLYFQATILTVTDPLPQITARLSEFVNRLNTKIGSIMSDVLTVPMTTVDKIEQSLAAMEGPKDMNRSRPYDGQEHTDSGKRGETEVKGITFRDLRDCFVRAVLLSTGGDGFICRLDKETLKPLPLTEKEQAINKRMGELYDEACKGPDAKLNGNDLYGFDLDKLDPIAIAQNLTCEVERIMGIYPNVSPISAIYFADESEQDAES